MQTRQLGRTKLLVSSLGVGTVSLGIDYGIAAPDAFGRPSDRDAIATLRHALECGITLFDTAPAYGEAERLIGVALGAEQQATVATKVTIPKDADGRAPGRAELKRVVEHSLERSCAALRRSALDVVQIHNATVSTFADGSLLSALEAARERGTVRFIGASVYSEAEALAAIASARIDCLQVAYNLLDQRMANRVFPAAQAAGVGIIVRSALLKGALTERAAYLPAAMSGLRDAVDRARSAMGIDWASLSRIALRFSLSHPATSVVLAGARTVAELESAVNAAEEGPLPDTLLSVARRVAVDDDELVNPARWPIP